MEAPFFILGNPRSGTSLFRLMLNSNPSITVPPECGFLLWWHNKYQEWTRENSQDEILLRELVKDILSSKKIETWNLEHNNLFSVLFEKSPKTYAELCFWIYKCYSNKKEEIVGDKNNYYIKHLEQIHKIYPSAKYIHLVRDGRDVACSYRKLKTLNSDSPYKPNLPYEITSIAMEWNDNVSNIDSFLQKKISLTIKYEDLLSTTQNILEKTCSFLSVDYSEEMLNFHRTELHDEPSSTMPWKVKTLEKVDKSNVGKYKSELSNNELSKFKNIGGQSLKRFGYV